MTTCNPNPRQAQAAKLFSWRFRHGFLVICSLLAFSLVSPDAAAEGISVNKVDIQLGKDGYQLSAVYDINLNFVVKEALSRGVPIYFVGEFSLTRSRWEWLDSAQQAISRSIRGLFTDHPAPSHWSWLDDEVFRGEQTIKLSYNILTGRYRISRGALYQNFSSLEEALNILSRQISVAIPDNLLNKDDKYTAAVRMHLDIGQLPRPLQVSALTDSDWTLDSDWYRWEIRPADIPADSDTPAE